jgi:hypothetical protein
VHWYTPTTYSKYAYSDINKQYQQRLNQLEKETTASASDTAIPAILNLAAMPEHADIGDLHDAAEAGVQKAEKLGESLKRASADSNSIEEVATRPANNVVAAFSNRSQALEKNVKNLQEQVKSQKTDANFEEHLHNCMGEVKALRGDELRALDHAYNEAIQAARHAARGAQTEVRHEARQVWALSDRLASRNASYRDLTNKLQNRVEDAANSAENNSEELARRTQTRLEDNLEKAQGDVHQDAERRSRTLHEVQRQFHELEAAEKSEQSGSKSFLAQSDEAMYGPAPLALVALFGVACACLALFFKNKIRSVDLDKNLLG